MICFFDINLNIIITSSIIILGNKQYEYDSYGILSSSLDEKYYTLKENLQGKFYTIDEYNILRSDINGFVVYNGILEDYISGTISINSSYYNKMSHDKYKELENIVDLLNHENFLIEIILNSISNLFLEYNLKKRNIDNELNRIKSLGFIELYSNKYKIVDIEIISVYDETVWVECLTNDGGLYTIPKISINQL